MLTFGEQQLGIVSYHRQSMIRSGDFHQMISRRKKKEDMYPLCLHKKKQEKPSDFGKEKPTIYGDHHLDHEKTLMIKFQFRDIFDGMGQGSLGGLPIRGR